MMGSWVLPFAVPVRLDIGVGEFEAEWGGYEQFSLFVVVVGERGLRVEG
jgi:hypothetical protein